MNTITKKEFETMMSEMLVLQNKMNEVVNPNWVEAGYDWTLAIGQEASEGIEHYGWKWWKKQESDIAQLKLELVDIFHFMLSSLIEDNWAVASVYDPYLARKPREIIPVMKSIAAKAYDGCLPVYAFFNALESLEMSFHELYSMYVAKNVLNIFRQDHGYKEGTYIKNWQIGPVIGEDNEFLTEIIKNFKPGEFSVVKLTSTLEDMYSKVLRNV